MASRFPIKFGIQTPPEQASWAEQVRMWRFCEDLGYDTMWSSDHFVPGTGANAPLDWPVLDGWTALAGLVTQTKRVHCGVMITGTPYRHPPQLAKIATTIDTMSNGRLIMGIGAAWHKVEHEMYGVPWREPAERVHRMGEAVQIFKMLWTQERSTFNGKYYQVKDAVCYPKPVQKPSIPIWIGGWGEQLTLKYVAKYGDGWNLTGSPINLKPKLAALQRHCDTFKRDIDSIEKSVMHMRLITHLKPDEQKQFIEGMAKQRKTTYEDMRGHYMIGSTEEMRDTIGKLIDLGFTHFVCQIMPTYDYDGIERWHTEVGKHFKGK